MPIDPATLKELGDLCQQLNVPMNLAPILAPRTNL
jgi:hypothetical protein